MFRIRTGGSSIVEGNNKSHQTQSYNEKEKSKEGELQTQNVGEVPEIEVVRRNGLEDLGVDVD